jgi:hypothetical protein
MMKYDWPTHEAIPMPALLPAHVPTLAWPPSAGHKEEAVCKHFLVVASDEKPRQKLLQAADQRHGRGQKQTSIEK